MPAIVADEVRLAQVQRETAPGGGEIGRPLPPSGTGTEYI
jgi:hypothetical protein